MSFDPEKVERRAIWAIGEDDEEWNASTHRRGYGTVEEAYREVAYVKATDYDALLELYREMEQSRDRYADALQYGD